MKVLSLFSGGGLGDYGLTLAGMEIVGQVEIDEYCQKILSLRWPEVPKWRDIRDVRGEEVPECDIITGGFPCQPFSQSGKRRGKEDSRWLWPEMHRIICEAKPKYVLVENVPELLSVDAGRVFGGILRDLARCGFNVEWRVLSAGEFGAVHLRKRVFLFAYPASSGFQSVLTSKDWVDTSSWWKTTPSIPRVVNGVAVELERLRICGNGQVVQVVEWIGKRIMEYEKEHNEIKGGGNDKAVC